jgi:excisionase family DNA binding protein
MKEIPQTFTPSQIAERLGLKVSTIYAMLSRGELQAYHYGRRRLISEEQLQRYLGNRRTVEIDMTYSCGPALKLSR